MQINVRLVAVQVALALLMYALPLFLPAGIRAWPAAWIFLVLWLGFWLAILLWLSRHNPGLLVERMRLRTPDQQGWDKMLGPLLYVSIFAWLCFISFDSVRFRWSPVSVWLQVVGVLILLDSFYLYFLTFRENSYLSPLVRIQDERGQMVISSGPYHYVRHPMYAATVIFVAGTPLLLGAWIGIPLGLIIVLILGWRAVLEEKALRQDLAGYATYMAQVKYRFIPYVW